MRFQSKSLNKILITVLCLIIFLNCKTKPVTKTIIIPTGETVKERISPPKDYTWFNEGNNSFGYFLENLPLKKDGAEILDYSGQPVWDQNSHVAVIDLNIGNKDLQQCADVIIRLRADYLREQNRENEIGFHFTSGHLFKWNDFKNGDRPLITGSNQVDFVQTAGLDDSPESYRKYLNTIFMYAGTISLNNETKKITDDNDITTGCFIITPGSPGHAIFIIGTAKNSADEKVYLLAEGYTPAQSIHIIKNPYDENLSPWYNLSTSDSSISTARYNFGEANIRAFQ